VISQIRIYTINRGQMDEFLKHFNEQTMPLHEKVGIPIVGTWVNRPQNEFIWVRTFADEQERDAKLKAFQDGAREAGIVLGGNVAKMEVRETEPAFEPAAARA
jgi:NIPSNAP